MLPLKRGEVNGILLLPLVGGRWKQQCSLLLCQGKGGKEDPRISLHNRRKKKSNPVFVWNNLTLTYNCFFSAARTDEKKCKPTWRTPQSIIFWCKRFLFRIPVKSVAKVNSTGTDGRWTKMKQDTFSKDSFRPSNCSSYQVRYIGFSSAGHISQCQKNAKIGYHVYSFPPLCSDSFTGLLYVIREHKIYLKEQLFWKR